MASGVRWILKTSILIGALLVMMGCALFTTGQDGPDEREYDWNGLRVDPQIWVKDVDQGAEVLRHVPSKGCLLEVIRGGSDVPPDWSVAKSRTTLGDVGYEVFEVRSPEGIEYVNYFYRPGEEQVNIGGFQVRPGADPASCVEAAETLFSTLDPEGLRLRTPTPAG